MIRLLLADDHAILREGLKRLLEDEPEIEVAAEAADGQGALEMACAHQLDAVILDVSMPGMSGLDVLKRLRMARPCLPVLILSMHSEEQYGIRLLRAGASGYLTKDRASEEMITAIKRVAAGGVYITPSLAEKLTRAVRSGTGSAPHESLSDREFQVMQRLATGKSLKETAAELFLSIKTVSTYRKRVLDKLNLASNAELTRYSIEHGLTSW